MLTRNYLLRRWESFYSITLAWCGIIAVSLVFWTIMLGSIIYFSG